MSLPLPIVCSRVGTVCSAKRPNPSGGGMTIDGGGCALGSDKGGAPGGGDILGGEVLGGPVETCVGDGETNVA